MDLNDPRRRLQVLNQSNPSLRSAVAPAPKISVAPPTPAQTLNVSQIQPGAVKVLQQGSVPAPKPQPAAPAPAPQKSWLSKAASGIGNFISAPVRPLAAGVARLLPGGQNDIKANEALGRQIEQNQQVYTQLYKEGKLPADKYASLMRENSADFSGVGREAQRIADTADRSQVVGSALMTASAPFLGAADLASSLAGKVGLGALEGIGAGGANEFATKANPTTGDVALGAGLGGLVGGAIPGLSRLATQVAQKLGLRIAPPLQAEASQALEDTLPVGTGVTNEIEQVLGEAASPMSPTRAQNFNATDFRKMQDEAIRLADAEDVAADLRFNGPGHTAAQAAQDPKVSKAIAESGSTSADSLTQVVNALASTDKKATIRDIVEKLQVPVEGNVKNRLVKDLIGETNPQKVAQRILSAMDESDALVAAKGPATATQQVGQAVEELPVPNGVSEGPGGAATKVAAADTLGQTVAENADEAVTAAASAEKTAQTTTNYGKAGDNLSDETKAFVQEKLNKSLGRAKRDAQATAKGYAQQRAQRAAAALEQAKGLSGSDRVNAIQRAMAGELDKVKYRGLVPDMAGPERDAFFERTLNEVIQSPAYKNRAYDTMNFRAAWERAVKPDEFGSPRDHEIKAIREALGDGIANQIKEEVEASKTGFDHFKEVLADLTGMPKGIMASLDFSFGLRQGAKLGSRFPKEWLKAQGLAAKFVVDPKFMEKTVNGIKEFTDDAGDNIYDGLRQMGLKLNLLDDAHEEQMAGVQHLRDKALKLLKFGKDRTDKIERFDPLAMSDRAYSGAATMQRALTAQTIINKYGGIKAMSERLGPDGMKAMGKVINSATGAADLGSFEKFAPFLAKTLFSPRLWKSNLDVINPNYYIQLAKASPEAAKLALQTNAAFLATTSAIVAAAGAVGADVELDPTSSDFMKMKVGNTRYDIMGGLQQNIVLAAREILNKKKNSETGEVSALSGEDHKYGGADRLSIVLDFLQNKSNPLLGTAATILKGTDRGGNPVNRAGEFGKMFVPLGIQSTVDTAKDTGSAAKGVGMNIPGFFGASVQTYGNTKTKDASTPVGKKTTAEGDTKREIQQMDERAVPGQYALSELPDGRYHAIIDGKPKTFDNLKKAQDAIAEDSFEKGSEKQKTVRGIHYFKGKDGKPQHESETLYNYKQDVARLNLEMDRASAAKDTATWNKLAKQKLAALENKKSLYDPETEQDEIDKINLEQENLYQKMDKNSGGTKGKDPGLASLIPSASFSGRGSAMPRFTVTRPKPTLKLPLRGGGRKSSKRVSINL